MALPNLAEVADLQDRGVDVTDTDLMEAMLAAASASVRGAAGSPILETDSTVVLSAWGDQLLELPGQPVTAVASATLDDEAVTDFKLTDGRLWLRAGWGCSAEPSEVVVSLTHGLPEVPADILDLVCNLASAGAAAASSGETFDPRVSMERIDDYSVAFNDGEDAVASVMDLPAPSRARLRARFGGGASVLEYR